MGRNCIRSLLVVLVVFLSAPLSIRADDSAPVPEYTFSDQELDNLLARIALYPDPLLAQILPASTYPSEVAEEAAWLRRGGDISRIDETNWSDSVKTIAHYPNVLYMMADNMDWTADLGDAFLNQPEDVTKSIQRLRWRAQDMGNLVNTNQQRVIFDGDDIQIDPAQPQYMYVPVYNPAYVYVQAWTPGMAPFITFGSGLLIGDWLSMDFDWHRHNVFYHGWNRPGWVNNARPYVHMTNVYINKSRPFINQTWRHDASHGDPDRYRARQGIPKSGANRLPSEVRGRGITTSATPSGGMFGISGTRGDVRTFSNRGRESLRTSQQGRAQPAAVNRRPETVGGGFSHARPAAGPTASAPQMQRPPSGAFGGYRGAHETAAQSLRGQSSRQSWGGGGQGARTAPAGRSIAPSGGRSPRR